MLIFLTLIFFTLTILLFLPPLPLHLPRTNTQVSEQSRHTNINALQTAIYESLYYTVSDKNHDRYVSLDEFILGCTKLKNR